jgi:hypothetical protein
MIAGMRLAEEEFDVYQFEFRFQICRKQIFASQESSSDLRFAGSRFLPGNKKGCNFRFPGEEVDYYVR